MSKDREYYIKNKEKIKERTREYKKNHLGVYQEYMKEYRSKNRVELKRKNKEYYYKNKERFSTKRKEYSIKNKERIKKYMEGRKVLGLNLIQSRSYYQRKSTEFRYEILSLLGMKCIKCGYDKDIRALQIDHVFSDGYKVRYLGKNRLVYYKGILGEVKEGSKRYQILCANCNFIKRYENNELQWKKY